MPRPSNRTPRTSLESERSRLHLECLHRDILRELFFWFDVKDIVCMRMTCRRMSSFSNERIVWVDAVRSYCIENRMALSSFSIAQAETRALEKALTTSLICAWRLTKDAPVEYREKVIRLHYPRDDLQCHISDMVALPGGRYILTGSSTGWLVCWDLGEAPSNHYPTPLAQTRLSDWIYGLDITPLATEDAYSIIAVYDIPDVAASFHHFKMTMTPNEVHFQELTSTPFKLPVDWRCFDTSPDLGAVTVIYDDHIIVCFLEKGTYGFIKLPGAEPHAQVLGINNFFHGESIVSVQQRGGGVYVSAHEIPPSYPTLNEARLHAARAPAVSINIRLDHEAEIISPSMDVVIQPSWASPTKPGTAHIILQQLWEDTGGSIPFIIANHVPELSSLPATPIPIALPRISFNPRQLADAYYILLGDTLWINHIHGGELVSQAVTLSTRKDVRHQVSGRKSIGWTPAGDPGTHRLTVNPWRGEYYIYQLEDFARGEVRLYETADAT